MNRAEFMKRLEELLADIPEEERVKSFWNIMRDILKMAGRNEKRRLSGNWKARK